MFLVHVVLSGESLNESLSILHTKVRLSIFPHLLYYAPLARLMICHHPSRLVEMLQQQQEQERVENQSISSTRASSCATTNTSTRVVTLPENSPCSLTRIAHPRGTLALATRPTRIPFQGLLRKKSPTEEIPLLQRTFDSVLDQERDEDENEDEVERWKTFWGESEFNPEPVERKKRVQDCFGSCDFLKLSIQRFLPPSSFCCCPFV